LYCIVLTYRLAHLSVCVHVSLSIGPENVLWQNGQLDPDAVGMVSGAGQGMGVGPIRWDGDR